LLFNPVWFSSGDRLFVSSLSLCNIGSCSQEVVVLDVQNGEISLLEEARWLENPAWTADPDILGFNYEDESRHGIFKSSIKTWAPEFVAEAVEAAWSPDGRYVALSRYEKTTSSGIIGPSVYLINLIVGNEMMVFEAPKGRDSLITGIAWSPDSGWLAISANWLPAGVLSGGSGLYIVHPDGTGFRQLTEYAAYPGWMPDGDWIFYTGREGLSFAPLDFSCVVSPLDYNDIASPVLSPSGDELAFELDGNIYILDLHCPDQ
jgi:WD40 repeat protein